MSSKAITTKTTDTKYSSSEAKRSREVRRGGSRQARTINTKKAPVAIGPYSQAVVAGGFVFCSGQIGLDPQSGKLVDGGAVPETERAILNLKAVLEEAGCKLSDVVKTTLYLKNMADFAAVNEIYANYFISKPARATVEVSALPKGALVEIECIALKNE